MENSTIETKISELRDKLNRLEMLDEVEKTDVRTAAEEILSERFYKVLRSTGEYAPISEALKCAANSVLMEFNMRPILDGDTQADIVSEYLDRFCKSDTIR